MYEFCGIFWSDGFDSVAFILCDGFHSIRKFCQARLAQSVEHQTFNLRVAGSSPSSGGDLFRKELKLQLVSVRVMPNFLCDGFHP